MKFLKIVIFEYSIDYFYKAFFHFVIHHIEVYKIIVRR